MGIDHDNFILSQHIQNNYFDFFEKNEQSIFCGIMKEQHNIALNKLLPELNQIFKEYPSDFEKRISNFLI